MKHAGTSNRESKSLLIADCRPRVSALANKGKGYGFEDASNYMNTTLEFLGIDNIHAIRGAYQRLESAVQSHKPNDSLTWGKQVEDSNWLYYVRMVRHSLFLFCIFSFESEDETRISYLSGTSRSHSCCESHDGREKISADSLQ